MPFASGWHSPLIVEPELAVPLVHTIADALIVYVPVPPWFVTWHDGAFTRGNALVIVHPVAPDPSVTVK